MATEGVQRYSLRLELTPTTSPLAIDAAESAEMRIQRLISENPVIIFSSSPCYIMCHVMRSLLSNIGVHPTVIELEDDEVTALGQDSPLFGGACDTLPAMYIGGTCVGNFESLVTLHLSNNLVPKLVEVGALTNKFQTSSFNL